MELCIPLCCEHVQYCVNDRKQKLLLIKNVLIPYTGIKKKRDYNDWYEDC